MPSKNPKHNKKVYYERKKQYSSNKIPIKYFAMGFILICSVVGVVFLAKFLSDYDPNDHGDKLFIEDGDVAELHYKLWIDGEERDGFIDIDEDPYQESTNFITTVAKGGLINGFYYEILDLEIGEITDFVIDPNIDADGDGFDDINPDEEVLGYGAPGHTLFNMTIYYWIQVVNITKSEGNSPASSNYAVQIDNLSDYSQFNFLDLFLLAYIDDF